MLQLLDNGAWHELCGALQHVLSSAKQHDVRSRTLRLVRSLVRAAADDAAGVQLAQLFSLQAAALCCAEEDTCALADALLHTQQALHQAWKARRNALRDVLSRRSEVDLARRAFKRGIWPSWRRRKHGCFARAAHWRR